MVIAVPKEIKDNEYRVALTPEAVGTVVRSGHRVLVEPTAETSLLDIARIQNRLQKLLGVPVDVLTPKALPERFRARVLAEAVPL